MKYIDDIQKKEIAIYDYCRKTYLATLDKDMVKVFEKHNQRYFHEAERFTIEYSHNKWEKKVYTFKFYNSVPHWVNKPVHFIASDAGDRELQKLMADWVNSIMYLRQDIQTRKQSLLEMEDVIRESGIDFSIL